MFEVGFWEIILVLVIALLVIGPDKLPGIARQVGVWVGRTRAYINSVKSDIDRELRLQELQALMQKNDVHEIIEETKASLTLPPEEKTAPATTDSHPAVSDKTSN